MGNLNTEVYMDKKQSGEKYNNKWVNDILMMITTGNNNKMNKNIIDTWIELEKRSHIKKEKEKIKAIDGKKKPQRKGKTVQHNEKKNKKQNKTRSLHAICTKGTKTLKERARGIASFTKQKPIQPISLSSSLVYIFLEQL